MLLEFSRLDMADVNRRGRRCQHHHERIEDATVGNGP